MFISLEHWHNPEVHSSVFSWQLILLQRFSTPTINTTHTHHCGIQREVSVLRQWYLITVTLMLLTSLIKVRNVIVQCTRRESSFIKQYSESTTAVVSLLPPANAALRTCFLWTNVREELLVSSLLIASDAL